MLTSVPCDVLSTRIWVFGGLFSMLDCYFGSWLALGIAVVLTLFLSRV